LKLTITSTYSFYLLIDNFYKYDKIKLVNKFFKYNKKNILQKTHREVKIKQDKKKEKNN